MVHVHAHMHMHLHSLFDWIFTHIHSEDVSDDKRTVFLNGLREALAMDGGKLSSHGALPVGRLAYLHVPCSLSLPTIYTS